MPTHFLVKGTADSDSYYQSLIVHADGEESARRAAERYLEDDQCRLLAFDPSGTRQVASHPATWRVRSTPFGVVAGGGRVFMTRRFATKRFREIASVEYAGVSVRAILDAIASLCRDADLILAAMGARVPGASRVRCGLGVVHLIEPSETRTLPEVERILAGEQERCALFILPARERPRILATSGLWCRPAELKNAITEAASCVIEEGDFLCREEFAPRITDAIERTRQTEGMRDG